MVVMVVVHLVVILVFLLSGMSLRTPSIYLGTFGGIYVDFNIVQFGYLLSRTHSYHTHTHTHNHIHTHTCTHTGKVGCVS